MMRQASGGSGGGMAVDRATLAEERQRVAAQLAELEAKLQAQVPSWLPAFSSACAHQWPLSLRRQESWERIPVCGAHSAACCWICRRPPEDARW